jgi:RNA-directed DNA polymerase
VEDNEIAMLLLTLDVIRTLQRKLYYKAKQEPKFRFYSLYDKVYRLDILEHAYKMVKANKGKPGIDGVSFEDIEKKVGITQFLAELRSKLKEGIYQPDAVKRVMIPKSNGDERPLGIPTIRDRTVQMAVKLVIEPIFEADFEDHSYGFRPKRSAHDAIEEIADALITGHSQVVDADLSKYFDTIPHAKLMKVVAERICDKSILKLIKQWLKASIIKVGKEGVMKNIGGGKNSRFGTPQGG